MDLTHLSRLQISAYRIMTARLYTALEWGNSVPLALMVCARADSYTLTRLKMKPTSFFRSVDVGPTDSPSFVVFAIVRWVSYPLIVVLQCVRLTTPVPVP